VRALLFGDERTFLEGLGFGAGGFGALGDPLADNPEFMSGDRMAFFRHLTAFDDRDEFTGGRG